MFKLLAKLAKFLGALVGIARPARELVKVVEDDDPPPSTQPIPFSPRAITSKSKPPPTRH